jgi:hypothetical protein
MRVAFHLWAIPLAAALGFAVARVDRPAGPTTIAPGATKVVRPDGGPIRALSQETHHLNKTGSQALPEIFAAVEGASPSDLLQIAKSLLNDPRRRGDLGVWGPLLARWAEVDGAGLIAFVEKDAAPGERAWLEREAWYAWGAADPQTASTAGKELSIGLARTLISGMAQADVRVGHNARRNWTCFTVRGLNFWILKSELQLPRL